ncbi:hypothetical protein JTB14_029121 [Gonioctena quinquepunctata]|nr:hypothetical protein JTB14_029121 [Gonioctena quinquepunctata]
MVSYRVAAMLPSIQGVTEWESDILSNVIRDDVSLNRCPEMLPCWNTERYYCVKGFFGYPHGNLVTKIRNFSQASHFPFEPFERKCRIGEISVANFHSEVKPTGAEATEGWL